MKEKYNIDLNRPTTPLPCLLYFHGSGFGLKGAPFHKELAILHAHEENCRVVFPDYHLLPRYPYPEARKRSVYRLFSQNMGNSESTGQF